MYLSAQYSLSLLLCFGLSASAAQGFMEKKHGSLDGAGGGADNPMPGSGAGQVGRLCVAGSSECEPKGVMPFVFWVLIGSYAA
jgi:hypothetical protein